ncbi:hypothetical protein [Streptomyces sp. NPDC001536]|uniref:hypothetical protein n=1 Tax=Streptomyces sp. NPDC001536 TaxID=3364583 RepID=UPI00368C1D0A
MTMEPGTSLQVGGKDDALEQRRTRLMGAAEEAVRRGRTEGVPGGHQDVHPHKVIGA